MLDIKYIRENPDLIKKGISSKNINPSLVDEFLAIDTNWRSVTKNVEDLRSDQKKAGEARDITKAKLLKDEIKALEGTLKELDEKRNAILRQIPNLPLSSVPIGKDETDNIVLREVGKKKVAFPIPKDYLSLGEELNIINIERASKVSGSRFGYLIGDAALLEFALVQLAFQTLGDEKKIKNIIRNKKLMVDSTPFIPVVPPVLIKSEMMAAMGYMDRSGEEIYSIQDDLYLVGTSEQSIGPMHAGETFAEIELPRRYVSFSSCFRREAGSYGKDTKGILRVHQFDKVEMFSITTPDKSEVEHQLLLAIEEHLMQLLKLPYHVLNICTGDLGDPAASKFDIEAWMPGQKNGLGEYRETHSTSNTTDFQSRRLNIKYRKEGADSDQGAEYVHMLNGTVFAIGRMLIAIIENYQNNNGKILVPKVLQKYLGKKVIKSLEH
ncbi:MAG: serine--tRNA ligase [bacterium]|nr:serine--tRNA ligase [bacterium]